MDSKCFMFLYNLGQHSPYLCKISKFIIKYATLAITIIFFAQGIFIWTNSSTKIFIYLVIPFITFVFTTFLRNVINRPRPFEIFDIKPAILHKDGKSFPSRHTVSSFIISFAVLSFNFPLGIISVILSLLIGISRIIVGVHFPSDIFGAVILSCIFGIGFILF